MSYILLLIGFIVLIKGADLLVDGGASLGKRLSVSNIVIGLTVVAFGTSAPESVVTIFSAVQGESDLAFANIVGSVVTNILLGIGLAAIVYPLIVPQATVRKEIPFSIFVVLVLLLLINDQWSSGVPQLSRLDGVVLLGLFGIFMMYTYYVSRMEKNTINDAAHIPIKKSLLYIVVGLTGLFFGGTWVVNSAITIANQLGVSETIIGLIVTGPGTALPEITATIIAARKRHTDLAIGGIVGSNIFNILFILGMSGVVGPVEYNPALNFDIGLLLSASIVLFLALFIGKRYRIERWQGCLFLGLYLLYIVNLFIRH